jgi:DNA-binding MarR family transcriptional regulator
MTKSSLEIPDVTSEPGGSAVRLPWLLRWTNQCFRVAIRDVLADRGFAEVPQPGYWALMILARGSTDARQLIREMGVSKQAVSKLVDALVAGGFVDRRSNDSDRRRTDLHLSDRGRRAAEAIAHAVRETEAVFIGELGSERFEDLVEMLEQLASRHN